MTAATLPSAVFGQGFLAEHLVKVLRERDAAEARVLVADLDSLADHHDLIVECLGTARPLLFVGLWRSLVYVGPYWTPGHAGCPQCLVTRTANSPYGPDKTGDALTEGSSRDATAWLLGPGSLRVAEQLVRARLEGGPADGGHVLVLDGATGVVESQILLPDSTCPTCGIPRAQNPPEFTVDRVPLTKLGPGRLRTALLDAGVVQRDYLYSGLGLFKELKQDLQSPFGACSVELTTQWGRREPAIGRASSYLASRTVAVLEGLERYAGLYCGGRSAAVRACYRDVAGHALYPPELGVHPDESYRVEGFRYRAFDPEIEIDWVWGYSFRQRTRILIPERCAFWGPRHDGEVSFVYDTSNGCALGNSPEEAVLHGLREVAERDAFLLTWYRKLALPEVEMNGASRALDTLLRKSRLFTGFEFRCFQATMEYGMPAFVLVAQSSNTDGPVLFTGCGAHPDPVQAIHGGLYELVGTILATRHSYLSRRPAALEMLADPKLVRRMEDHSLVGALPEAHERFSFLLDRRTEPRPLAGIESRVQADPDLRADLDAAVAGLLGAGLDVIAVDQTMPELDRNGLSCMRVLVPGLVPMTFGHVNRRTVNLPRLAEGVGVPYRSQLSPGEEIGCLPHPFP